MDTKTQKIHLQDNQEAISLFGTHDANLKKVEEAYQAQIVTRGTELMITGLPAEVDQIEQLFSALLRLIRQNVKLNVRDISYAIELSKSGNLEELIELFTEEIGVTFKGKPIRVKTLGQRRYINQIRKHDIVFGIGPAGTGKTYLAVVMAVQALKKGLVKRIILTRPAVEAGENLGFLPGDLQEKVDPYLRPLYDGLYDVFGAENVAKSLERGAIEIAPLAYMRGRTLDDSFVILDEAQNTTHEQMKMFLTRLGFGSKMVITGDITQVDLPKGKRSGLHEAVRILKDVKGISFVQLHESDVVRHQLVQRIIAAYQVEEEA
ncbi:PhoH family protein [Fodinisporobacter ferrooxydans]|uniref:PhoH-like protein n=1 Tax=Fodinisporobacter ferrooxydans TaxID=2901836 RepID=A0ABY4CEL6_9BACL|nr:PhoH family protein [Alicyclobacillaceae bacterium MYW30-H2]